MKRFMEKLLGDLGDKRRWRAYRSRVRALPEPYRTAAGGMERYFMYFGGVSGETGLVALEDLAELFEGAAADGTELHVLAGDDPVEFAEAFFSNYEGASWIDKERSRLVAAFRAVDETDRQS